MMSASLELIFTFSSDGALEESYINLTFPLTAFDFFINR